jgi:hypothetical protein
MRRADSARAFIGTAALGVAAFASAMLGLTAAAALAASAGRAGDGAPARHLGVATCASTLCHGSAKPLDARAVLQNEYVTWSHFDPHGRAWRVLLEPAAQGMARRLGLGPAEKAPACLACHTDDVPEARRGPRFQVSDGVGCEACHGGAEHWLATHYQSPEVTHADNVARGLVPLGRPAVRAEVCLDCHAGDAQRFATHRMMAAGHPRLTFELDTYTEIWRTAGGREHYRPSADAPRPLDSWIAGLAASTNRAMQLAADHARGAGPLPEFGVYACHSCHRALGQTAWGREDESAEGLPPGALRLPDGAARALIAVGEALAVPATTSLRAAVKSAQLVANSDIAALGSAAAEVRRSADAVASALRARTWTAADRRAALNGLSRAAQRGAFADYAAAEQAAMGMVVLLEELGLARSAAPDVDRLFAALESETAFDGERFAAALARLEAR